MYSMRVVNVPIGPTFYHFSSDDWINTQRIFFLSCQVLYFPNISMGRVEMFSNLFSKYCFQIFCLAAAQVWKLKHRMARGGLKVLRLTSGSGNPTIQRLQKLKMIDINLSRNMRRKVFSSGRSSLRSQAKVEVFICYRFFELWHNLLLPTHWLSSLLKFQAIMVLSNLCKF